MTLSGASLGVLALHSYHRKDAYLIGVEREMRVAGRSTTAEGCVDHVLAWRPRCQGSPLLCDSFAPRAMRACLEAKERAGYCQSLPARRGTARFGFADCKRRSVTRATRKTCGAAFKMLDLFCRERERRE